MCECVCEGVSLCECVCEREFVSVYECVCVCECECVCVIVSVCAFERFSRSKSPERLQVSGDALPSTTCHNPPPPNSSHAPSYFLNQMTKGNTVWPSAHWGKRDGSAQ
jgi:hypothetical protein